MKVLGSYNRRWPEKVQRTQDHPAAKSQREEFNLQQQNTKSGLAAINPWYTAGPDKGQTEQNEFRHFFRSQAEGLGTEARPSSEFFPRWVR